METAGFRCNSCCCEIGKYKGPTQTHNLQECVLCLYGCSVRIASHNGTGQRMVWVGLVAQGNRQLAERRMNKKRVSFF